VTQNPDRAARELLRHAVATVAYRGGKAVRGAPPGFSAFRAAAASPSGYSARTPGEILAHIGDLFDWALSLAQGVHVWKDTPPADWDSDVARFFAALGRFDAVLASESALGRPVEKLLQGPVADAPTHIGQIAVLRRMAGAPIRGESYFQADIAAGRIGPDQAAPRKEFD